MHFKDSAIERERGMFFVTLVTKVSLVTVVSNVLAILLVVVVLGVIAFARLGRDKSMVE